ncbi:MAG: aspartate/glutamate racemase family protein [Candidatus Aminicenantes bacterium]|nr:aspartate/glutamate racemase family protein [Candidatus Aminicenantes bacterium]
MKKKATKTIGILGGMGPEATARFFELIIKNTAAAKDQEHLKIVVLNYPQIPDRTGAILYGGENPVPYLIEGLKLLEKAGAELVAIPCMTAHYFLPRLKEKTRLKLVNLIEEAALWTKLVFPKIKKVGLLATEGTIATGIFQKVFERKKIQVLTPSKKVQKKTMEAIYGEKGIKAGFIGGKPKRLLLAAAEELLDQGAEALIAGCTEIPLVLTQKDVPVPLIDPMTIGARVLIKKAGGRIRS